MFAGDDVMDMMHTLERILSFGKARRLLHENENGRQQEKGTEPQLLLPS